MQITDDLQDKLDKFGMKVITSESFSGDPADALKQIKVTSTLLFRLCLGLV